MQANDNRVRAFFRSSTKRFTAFVKKYRREILTWIGKLILIIAEAIIDRM